MRKLPLQASVMPMSKDSLKKANVWNKKSNFNYTSLARGMLANLQLTFNWLKNIYIRKHWHICSFNQADLKQAFTKELLANISLKTPNFWHHRKLPLSRLSLHAANSSSSQNRCSSDLALAGDEINDIFLQTLPEREEGGLDGVSQIETCYKMDFS